MCGFRRGTLQRAPIAVSAYACTKTGIILSLVSVVQNRKIFCTLTGCNTTYSISYFIYTQYIVVCLYFSTGSLITDHWLRLFEDQRSEETGQQIGFVFRPEGPSELRSVGSADDVVEAYA